jgi:hydrogenase nickel incorporation protein HypA/HybF
MHELSLAAAIVDICRANARGGRVVRVEVKVGRLRQVVPDALTFAFGLVGQGTPVEGAELVLADVPARVTCDGCGAESGVERFPLACARCGSGAVEVVAGEELQVESIDVEDEPVAVGGR